MALFIIGAIASPKDNNETKPKEEVAKSEKQTETVVEPAQYAIDNLDVDWKENALKKAETYAERMSMSDSGIYEQLISEYGEKFTAEEAQYAIDNLK
ncbi:hypothetical protein GCM10007425_04880 [Lysinibacillus alkalisoli]|uniref:Putative host cell surface-exposed lipoprotein Ltp-like HTH region domain-containing protein n=1 Tax=Lysinibacillus alkalisoli TaxID=1911548 RepID=A0A917D7A7_9BACI|nr:Ltp family lipoprotein [Lysinibacillus alkalisoli]GGG13596.1 hypothetical protein GCM10007425_04880 [Lysinibacillus alkalisoli]